MIPFGVVLAVAEPTFSPAPLAPARGRLSDAGSLSEADDALQEAWVRIHDRDPENVENMQAWLTTVVGRGCLNMLRSRRARGEEISEAHVPDPVVSLSGSVDPEQAALLADSVGLALLVVVDAFFAASRDGDFDALLRVLQPDVELRIDGGVLREEVSLVLRGADAVAEQTATYSRLYPFVTPALVNGAAGAVVAPHGRLFSVRAFTVTKERTIAIEALVDPERLAQLDLETPPPGGDTR
jgi:hypothetical protein